MNNKDKGNLGEDSAAQYLINQGYKIIARNYSVTLAANLFKNGRVHKGEIDIIATKDNTINFIEVKTRNVFDGTNFGRPAKAVDDRKKSFISFASKEFLRKFSEYKDFCQQIEIIEVFLDGDRVINIKKA